MSIVVVVVVVVVQANPYLHNVPTLTVPSATFLLPPHPIPSLSPIRSDDPVACSVGRPAGPFASPWRGGHLCLIRTQLRLCPSYWTEREGEKLCIRMHMHLDYVVCVQTSGCWWLKGTALVLGESLEELGRNISIDATAWNYGFESGTKLCLDLSNNWSFLIFKSFKYPILNLNFLAF